ncbi:MAG: hypothetical protein WBB19_06950 [Desulforhopalus sp.]
MLSGQLLLQKAVGKVLFSGGRWVVLLIALAGAGFELTLGGVCPRSSGGIPLCYLSLALYGVIGLLYRLIATPARGK